MVKMADSYTAAGITAANEASDEIIRDLTGKYRLACATIAERDAQIAVLKADVATLTATANGKAPRAAEDAD